MSLSRGDFDDLIARWAANAIAHTQRILDIGPGAGKFGHMLSRMKPDVDGLELNADFAKKFDLARWYRKIIIGDATTYPIPKGEYSLIIAGDILEHLPVTAAQSVIARAIAAAPLLLAVLPFVAPESGDNYAGGAHIQGDLTPEIIAQRYPALRLWLCNERVGVYFAGERAERELRLMRP